MVWMARIAQPGTAWDRCPRRSFPCTAAIGGGRSSSKTEIDRGGSKPVESVLKKNIVNVTDIPRIRLFAAHVVFPIFMGASIYLLWRSQELLMFDWLCAVGLSDSSHSIRVLAYPATMFLPQWILYSLPDGLWVYAVTAWMGLIWLECHYLRRYFWMTTGLMLGLGGEIGQAFRLIPGTFDTWDLVMTIVAFSVAFFVVETLKKGHES